MLKLGDHVPTFAQALKAQLDRDDKRYGNAWAERPREGQEERIFKIYLGYWHDYQMTGKPINWLKVAGLAMIAWLREGKD